MSLTKRDQIALNALHDWEQRLVSYVPNDFERTADKYIERTFLLLPEEIQKQVFTTLDTTLFHLHALIQGSQLQSDARERILTSARIFHTEIETIDDLKVLSIDQLKYLAEQQISRHRLYSLAQGGISGTGGALLLGMDIPAIVVINLRVIQLIATVYGHEMNRPYEMMSSLKIFHAATLPARLQGGSWQNLKEELSQKEDEYFYEGNEDLTDVTWLDQPLQQLIKALAIVFLKTKTVQGIPFLSMAVGAGMNYQLTRKVTDFAHHYYQMRYFLDKEIG